MLPYELINKCKNSIMYIRLAFQYKFVSGRSLHSANRHLRGPPGNEQVVDWLQMRAYKQINTQTCTGYSTQKS